jgi:hypothetical protein
MASQVSCPKCKATLLAGAFNTATLVTCGCDSKLQVEVFPALFRERAVGQSGEAVAGESESSCFYHAQKKAVITCEACGRFLCALCDVEMHGQHLCPACLESGARKGKLKNLQNQRTLYDSMALGLALITIPLFFAAIITAPIVLYLAIRHWKTPSSMIPRTRVRMQIAVVLAILELIGWGLMIYAMVRE